MKLSDLPQGERLREVRRIADEGLRQGKITQEEHDRLLMAELAQTKSAMPKSMLVLILALAIIGAWFWNDGSLTGLVTLDPARAYHADANFTLGNVTMVAVSGTLTNGSALIYANAPEGRLLILNATTAGRVTTDKQSYALGEEIAVSVDAPQYSLWLGTPAGERIPIAPPIITSAPGEYTLEALIGDGESKESTTFSVRADNDTTKDVPRSQTVTFEGACEQTCAARLDAATIEIILSEGASLELTDISTERSNAPPVQRATIPDLTLRSGETATVDLDMYFTDPDGDRLLYEAGIKGGSVNGSRLSIDAAGGTRDGVVYASDLQEMITSQTFRVVVLSQTDNTTDADGTENQTSAEPPNATGFNLTAAETNATNPAGDSATNATNSTTTAPPGSIEPPNGTRQNLTTADNSTAPANLTLDCSDPDPNKRPMECVQSDVNYFVEQELLLEDRARDVVGQFTPIGNLLLKGKVVQQSTASPSAEDYSLGYLDEFGEYRATIWIDSDSGDLHLRGTLTEANTNIVQREGWFGMANKRGILLAMADRQRGDMVIRGSVIPYRTELGVRN